MKKLMIAAVAVAFAAVAQAASVNWCASKIYVGNDSTSTAANYLCYMFVNETYAASSLASELEAANFANLSKAEASAASSSVMGEGYDYNTSLAVSDEPYNAYMVIFNAATAGAATKFFMTDVGDYDLIVSGAGDSIDFEKQGRYADDWVAIAPEPTSGLMLLLGMGVLALRRRRA